MNSYEAARIEVQRLVERFEALSATNRRSFNEAATRQEFILPLFAALGWDIQNTREVSPEEQVSKGYVDFAFRLDGIPRFFLETKKIPENLDDPRWAQQAINYSWLKGVPWAVLSDFEGLKIFNAEWKEQEPIRAIFIDLHWQEYLDRLDDLWLLSRDAIQEGAIDALAERVGKRVKKTPVDRKLFEDLATWRHELFRHLRPYNPLWSVAQVDEAVQRILNRLIFIRAVEDRLIEEQHLIPLLREWEDRGHGPDLVGRLSELFRELDDIYNARLFAPHFSESADCEPEPYVQVIEGLYELPGGHGFYDFSAIDADVLGAIYEQYLSYIAQDPEATEVVTKWSKRKRQGIYYTPRFVVRYIVKNTLGRVLEEQGLDFALNVRVLDPACGSGSFLIEAFDVLDDYIARESGQVPGEDPEADATRREHILAHNLYGVDLDAQAVEITRLNLWLRAVSRRGILPELSNIRRGNSLIDDTEVAGEAAFDWGHEFPEIMTQGGFDAIVGNPPYIRIQTLPSEHVAWFSNRYEAATGNYDIYVLFIERALELLERQGKAGFILPGKFFTTDYGAGLRGLLSRTKSVWQIVDFGHAQVFGHATTYTSLLFLQGSKVDVLNYYSAQDWLEASRGQPGSIAEAILPSMAVETLGASPWTFVSDTTKDVLEKLEAVACDLIDLPAGISRGSSTGEDRVFILKSVGNRLLSRQGEKVSIEEACLRVPIYATDFGRYSFHPIEKERIIFPYHVGEDGYRLIPEDEFSDRFPRAYGYLSAHRPELEQRKQWKAWYGYSAPRNLALHDSGHLLIPLLADRGLCCGYPSGEKRYCLMASGGFSISVHASQYSPLYILGLLNSTLLFWNLSLISNVFRGGWITCTKQYTGRLPIRLIDFNNPTDIAYHDHMVNMVDQMLVLKKEHSAAEVMLEDRRHDLAREIEDLDAQIDQLVYELYGLSEEEIALVEEGSYPPA